MCVQLYTVIRILFIENDHRMNISRFRDRALLTAIFPDHRGLQITDISF